MWIDETNFNLYCTRQYGRSTMGTRVKLRLANSKGRNLHIIGAISTDGLVKYTTKRGSFTAEVCQAWMTDLLAELLLDESQSFVVVCDNAPCHSGLENVFTQSRVQLLRLGPYSPALNPIEVVWSVLKYIIRREMSANYEEILSENPDGTMGKQEWRMNCLERVALRVKDFITPELCINAIKHVRHSYESVLLGHEI